MLVLVQRPPHKCTPDPVAAPKNIPFGTIFIEFGDTKKCCTFSGLELAPKSRKKLIGALSCMHKGPKCMQSLWDHPKKIPFVQKHKEGAICAILREKTPFLAFPEAKKAVVNCARRRKAAHWPNNNANPSGLSEKKSLLCKKGAICGILREKAPFLASPEAKKGVVNYASCARLRTGPIIMQIPRGYQKKSLLCRKARYVGSLGKKPHFWPPQRLKKVLLTTEGCARLRTGPKIMQIPRGYQKKKVFCVERRDMWDP